MILDHLDQANQAKLVQYYLEENDKFKLPLT
jgi:hypothetical protein